MRESVIAAFPAAPGLPQDTEAYLYSVDELYRSDACRSLSIEGYRVTLELIERVRSGDWDLDRQNSDRRSQDALDARGYWQAFRLVREAVCAVIAGDNPALSLRQRHAALRGLDAVRPNVLQAFLVLAEPETSLGLDGAGERALDPVYGETAVRRSVQGLATVPGILPTRPGPDADVRSSAGACVSSTGVLS